MTLRGDAPDGARLLAQVRLLIPIAQKALAASHPEAAERLLRAAVRDFQTLARCAHSDEAWALAEQIRAELTPAVSALEEATGHAWKPALDVRRPLRGGSA